MPELRRSLLGAVARATLSLLILAAVLVAMPYGLWSWGTLPAQAPTWSQAQDALLSPDDGSLLLIVLTLVGWALWLAIVSALGLEAVALLRHRAARRRPGLGGLQAAAAWLLGSLVLLGTPAAASAATPAVAATAQTTPHSPADAHAPSAAAEDRDSTARQETEPTHRVDADNATLWGIAEERLGDGQRWKDIHALNPQLNNGGDVPEGTVLHMPSDTPPPADKQQNTDREDADHHNDSSGGGDGTHVVQQGENLWGIAEDEYGDGSRYADIVDANADDLSDPDLIYPQQRLTIPGQDSETSTGETTPEPPTQPAPEHGGGDTEQPGSEPGNEAAPGPEGAGDAAQHEREQSGKQDVPRGEEKAEEHPGAETAAPETGPAAPSPTAPSPAESSTQAEAEETTEETGGWSLPALAAAAGGGLLIAGVLGGVGVRRVLQQRGRRRGRRIPMPTGRASETELDLRTVEPLDPSVLDRVLRTAAAGLAEQNRELPALDAVVLGGETAELHLREEAEPVAPFTLLAEHPQRWVCSLNSRALLDAETAAGMEAPWPGLVTIGTLPDDRLVLVDLEEIRLLRLAGPLRHALARSLAIELTVSQLADHLQLVLPESVTPGLASTSDRLEAYTECGEVIEPLRQHHRAQVVALEELEMERVRQARAADVGSGGWIPHVVIVDEAAAQHEDLEAVRGVVTARPGASTAVVISTSDDLPDDSSEETSGEGWVLRAGPEEELVQLPGSGLQVRLHLFDDASYEDIVEILSQAERGGDVPAPTPGVEPDAILPPAPLESCPESLSTAAPSLVKDATHGSSSPSEVVLPSPGGSLLGRLADDAEENEDDLPGGAYDDGDGQDAASESSSAPAETAVSSDTSGDAPSEDVSGGMQRSTAVPAQESSAPMVHSTIDSTDEEPPPGSPANEEVQAPLVRLLGPVEVAGAHGAKLTSNRLSVATELVTWLVLHPGRDRQTIEESVWRGRAVRRKTVTELVSRARAWLGTNEAGEPYLPVASGGGYRLHEHVTSDWHQFQQLVAHGQSTSGPEGARALQQALQLVRGRPFSGIPPTRYSWAESLMQEMISAITDAAEILAERYLVAGHPRDALWAVARGLEAGPEMEQLHRQRFTALRALGDIEGLRRAAHDLEWENAQRGLDTEEETHEMLRVLLADV